MSTDNIDTISLKAFSYIFSEQFNGNQRFCFILGSGTSRDAGIMTGKQMTEIWISELKNKYEKNELKELMKKLKVENLNASSENYFSIYDLRFYPDYRYGQAFLENELEKGVPGFGHYVLAKILANGKNNIAITTNFDSLIEDAIFMYTDKKAIIVGHESLSKFINVNIIKPIVVKIHRGLYYHPLNRKEELEDLKTEWKVLLRQIFAIYTPVVIGYAGGDQSLMRFLKDETLKLNKIYWCYWNKEEPSDEIKKLVIEKEGCLVPIDSFEIMMFELSRKLGIDRLIASDPKADSGVLEKYYSYLSGKVGGKAIAGIPEKISFLELYGATNPEALEVKENWEKNYACKSLTVPIGIDEKGKHINLDMHEKMHGPHGLIVGSTGSGKTDFLNSYILSLAVNYHPNEVGILLIDYTAKMAYSLFDLPHLLGAMTNLDDDCMRFIEAVKYELMRRQNIFSECGVYNINKYMDKFHEGKVNEPLPYLIILCSEFSDIKAQYPEFLEGLLQIARVGRGGGVSLILSTENPAAIVNEQIWSSSNAKICFGVQDENQSYSILRNSDASFITHVGKAYLKIGHNELYESFQAAWSGAPLEEKNKDPMPKITQLEAIVSYIERIYSEMKSVRAKKVCLPPLPDYIVSPYNKNYLKSDKKEKDMTLRIGLIDDFRKQTRQEYAIDFERNGHIVYMASDGFGKSMFLQNIILGLAIKNPVSALNFYIIDMGDYALSQYKKLNHVIDYLSYTDLNRIDVFINKIKNIIEKRKKILHTKKLKNVNLCTNQEVNFPAIVIVIDNYDHINELGKSIIGLINDVLIEGESVGVYLLLTVQNVDAIGMRLLENFKVKIAGFNHDQDQIYYLFGQKNNYLTEKKKGRALIKLDEICLMQLYLPISTDNFRPYFEVDSLINVINEI